VQFEGLAGAALDQYISYGVTTAAVSKALTSPQLRRFGLTSADDIMKFMYTSLWDRLKGGWGQEAMEAAAREVIERGATATVKQLLGWLTLGSMVVVSAGLDYGATRYLGWRLKWTTWYWMRDLMHQGSTIMGRREVRDCAFETYGRIVGADGVVHEHEKRLLLGYLATPFWESEAAQKTIGPEEIADQARTVRLASSDPVAIDQASVTLPACVGRALASADEQHRTVFLAHLFAMMHIDLDEDPQERWIYQKVRTELAGGMFRRLDEALVNEVERAVELEIGLSRGVVVHADGREFNTAEDFGITIEDIAPAMSDESIARVLDPFKQGWGEGFSIAPLPAAGEPRPQQPQP
jgi:hypothetical protein